MAEPTIYVDDGSGTLRRAIVVSEVNGEITFQDNPNSSNAYVEVDGVLRRVVLVANIGKASGENLGTGFDATKTQVLKNVNGTITWVNE